MRLERPPLTGFKYSGGGVLIQQLALMDAVGKPFAEIAREWVLDPIGMTNSTYEQPLPANRAEAGGARARSHRRAHGRSLARLSRAGRRRAVDHADRSGEVRDRGAVVAAREVESRALADDGSRNGDARRRRPVRGRVSRSSKEGEGWYFMHGGSNWGFQCNLIAHRVNGYGAVIMTNSDSGGALIPRLLKLIQQEYAWDVLDSPIPRRYGPL